MKKKEENQLPIVAPPIVSYQQVALPLSVAMLGETAYNWFYSNYIQVSCVNRKHYALRGFRDNALHYGFYNPDITLPEALDHICLEGNKQLGREQTVRYIYEPTNDKRNYRLWMVYLY